MSEKWLILFFRVVGVGTIFAFAGALMPQTWMVEIAEELGFEPFPSAPLTFYLARNLSLLYGFVGCALLVIASDFARYRPLVSKVGIGAIAFGSLQFLVDIQSGMPMWWTLYESLSTIFGGVLILVLDRKTVRGSGEPEVASSQTV
jgi:hypothetical protein